MTILSCDDILGVVVDNPAKNVNLNIERTISSEDWCMEGNRDSRVQKLFTMQSNVTAISLASSFKKSELASC